MELGKERFRVSYCISTILQLNLSSLKKKKRFRKISPDRLEVKKKKMEEGKLVKKKTLGMQDGGPSEGLPLSRCPKTLGGCIPSTHQHHLPVWVSVSSSHMALGY